MTLGAQTVERARDGARIGATLGGFTFEPVDLLDDFNGNQDIMLLKTEDGIGVVKKNVGVENVIFHCKRADFNVVMRACHSFNRVWAAGSL